jgi:hypothetical protein
MSNWSLKRFRGPLTRTTARNCLLINQFATPGLGSLLGRRFVAGVGQLLLAIAGFVLVVGWFIGVLHEMAKQLDTGGAQPGSVAWLGEVGGLLFLASWLWALVTSLSLLRQARENEAQAVPPPLPRP